MQDPKIELRHKRDGIDRLIDRVSDWFDGPPGGAHSVSHELRNEFRSGDSESAFTAAPAPRPRLDVLASIEFYAQNQHLLYRPVITLSVVFNLISIAIFVRMILHIGPDIWLIGPTLYWSTLWMLASPFAIVFALVARRKMDHVEANGLTLFAVMLVLDFIGGHLLLTIAGLYALLNSGMRGVWSKSAPEWYQRLRL